MSENFEPDVNAACPSFISDNKEFTLQLNAFNGSLSWSVFRREQKGRPVISIRMDGESLFKQAIILRATMKDGPEKCNTIIRNDYNRQERKMEIVGKVTFGKDDKGMVYIEIGSPQQSPIRFTLNPSRRWECEGFTTGAEGSVLVARYLATFMDTYIPTLLPHSKNKNAPKPAYNGNGGGKGNYQGGGNNYSRGGSGGKPPATEDDIY